MSVLRGLTGLARPLHIGIAAISYMLGVGMARYLGHETNLRMLGLGLLGVLLGQASMGLLEGVFRPSRDPLGQGETREGRRALRNAALHTSIAALAAVGFISYVVFTAGGLTGPVLINQVLALVVILLFAIPPIRIADSGLGELLLAVQMAHVPISGGFLLQAGSPHPLVYVCVGSLTLLLVATLVVLDFASFRQDVSYSRATLLTRVGWENTLRIHHLLLAGTYLILAAAPLSGFSLERFLPAFLTIPFAGLQVYLLQQMAGGAKPMWRLIRANAVALFVLTAYVLTLSFWFH
jgi:1,4-dihydroxy-2-naphthoate octaprenyltransferase